MTFALARSLLLADAVTPTALAEALFLSTTRGTSLVRALLAIRAIDALRLEQMLERGEAPYMRHIAPVSALVQQLPVGLCDRLLAIPVRRDARTGTVDVAVVDARDPHPAEEIGHWLKAPVRIVRTSVASMESALMRMVDAAPGEPDPGMRSLAPPIWEPPPTPTFDRPDGDADIAFPLTRRNLGPVIELGPPAVERRGRESDPVLDLRRRKPNAAPPAAAPSNAERGPFARAASAPPLASAAALVPLVVPAPSTAPSGFGAPVLPPPSTGSGRQPPGSQASAATILAQMEDANDRDRILELLVDGVHTVARGVAVLAVRRDALVGWTCSPEVAERGAFRRVRLPSQMPAVNTVFHDTLERDDVRLVRLPLDAAHAPFIAVLRMPPAGQVALAAVHTEGRAVAVLVADDLVEQSLALQRIEDLSRAAGESLGRLLRDKLK